MEIKLFVSDLDGTLLGTLAQRLSFKEQWLQVPPPQRPRLVYSTGRTWDSTLQAIQVYQLAEPDYVIGSMGTEIYDYPQHRIVPEFSETLQKGWHRPTVEAVIARLGYDIRRQPEDFQNAYKSSWYLLDATPDQLETIREKLEGAGLEVTLVYSSSRDLDILPRRADKGESLLWLLKHLRIRPEETLVAGDSGNDSAMFLIPGVSGIIVSNAQPELYQRTAHLPVYHARGMYLEGVIEGLVYYGVLDGKGE